MNDYYVYKHVTPNNKVYIGITKQNPSKRWLNGHGYKNSKHFYNAIIKYGWINICHEILESGLTEEEANQAEQKYIMLYQSDNAKFGYNIQSGGKHHSITNTSRMKKIKHGKNKGEAIVVFNLNGEYIGEFVSSYQAAKILNCDQAHIRKCCQHKEGRTQHKGFIFKYKKEVCNYEL